MAVREQLVQRGRIEDNDALGLRGALAVETITVGGRTFVYVTGTNESRLQVLELFADGTFEPVEALGNVAPIELGFPEGLATATVGGVNYLYVSARSDSAVNVFSVGADGTLTLEQVVADSTTLELLGTSGPMEVVSAGTSQYLVVPGASDDGVSVFQIQGNGRLLAVASVDDTSNPDLGLDGAHAVVSASVGGRSFVYVAGENEDAITAFSMNGSGALAFVETVRDVSPRLLNGVSDLETLAVGTKTFLFASGRIDDGVTVFEIGATGALTEVFAVGRTDLGAFDGPAELNAFTFAGEAYLAVSTNFSDQVDVFRVAADGSLSLFDTVTGLDGSNDTAFVTLGGRGFLVATAGTANSVTSFEIGVSADPIVGTSTNDFLVGTALDDTIRGLEGDDILLGAESADVLDGGDGDDLLQGGPGNDRLLGDGESEQTLSDTVAVTETGEQLSLSVTLPNASPRGELSVSGFISRQPITGADFNIVYVVDVSGSMNDAFSGGETVGDANNDGTANTLLDGTVLGFQALNRSVLDAGLGASNVTIVPFADAAVTEFTGRANGAVDAALAGLRVGGATNFEAALQQTVAALRNAPPGENRVFFISDGASNRGGSFLDEVATLLDAEGLDADIRAIGLGTGASLDQLDLVDDGVANNSAERVLTPSTLTASLNGSAVAESEIARVVVRVNGEVVRIVQPGEFEITPLGLRYDTVITGLSTQADDLVEVRLVASDTGATTAVVSGRIAQSDGASGDDVLLGGLGGDEMRGGGGNDRMLGEEGNDLMRGGDGNDRMLGGDGEDEMLGGDGDDSLSGGRDADRMDGGAGFDIVSYAGSGAAVVVNLAQQLARGGDARGDVLANFEGAYGSTYNDLLIGSGTANVLIGGGGRDTMRGGAGNDTYFLTGNDDTVEEEAGGGLDRVFVNTSHTLAANVENLVLTGTANIDATGNGQANGLVGNAGDNRLDGRGGPDTMRGGDGNDIYVVDNPLDRVIETGSTGFDRVLATVSVNLADTSRFQGPIEGASLTLGAGDANLFGNALANILIGSGGNNRIDGGAGPDIMRGGQGNDVYVWQAGDIVDEASFAANGRDRVISAESVNLSDAAVFQGAVEDVTLTGTAAANAFGNALANTLDGNGGVNRLNGFDGLDTLRGFGGNDVLNGGARNDVLTGDGGRDLFVFNAALANNVDRITDFQPGTDTIVLDDAVFTALAPGALSADAFHVAGTAGFDADVRIVYNAGNGVLLYDADGSGSGAAQVFAVLSGAPAIDETDFTVV